MTVRRTSLALVVASVLTLATGCSSSTSKTVSTPTTNAASSPTSAPPTTNAPSAGDPGAAKAQLTVLPVNDSPHSLSGYSRALFPQWLDIDGYGCDARQEVVIEASVTPPVVHDCKVSSGEWVSAYDGKTTTDPATFDVDHVVPLANAYESGAWSWSTAQRTQYANLPIDLWLVSATANRAKGDASPDHWRPPSRAIWCQYAERWVSIKARWHLTMTTSERDALGQMLDTCGASDGTPIPSTTSLPSAAMTGPTTTVAGTSTVYYANCAAARAAGAAPLRRGQPGYRDELDGDHDGVACE